MTTFVKGLRMRKFTTLVLSTLLIAAVSTTADAAKHKKKGAKAAPVVSTEASDAQRMKFWQDAWTPWNAR